MNEQNNQQRNLSFKQTQSRLLGPVKLRIPANQQPKGVDLALPAVSLAIEAKLFMQTTVDASNMLATSPESSNKGETKDALQLINDSYEYYLVPDGRQLRMLIKFSDDFYSKYRADESQELNLFVYVMGYIDQQIIDNAARRVQNQQQPEAQPIS